MTRPKKSPKRRPLNLRKDKRLRLLIHLKVEKKVWLKKLEELCKLCLDSLVGDLDHLQLLTLKKKKKKNLKKQPGKIFLDQFIEVIPTVDFRLPRSENVFFLACEQAQFKNRHFLKWGQVHSTIDLTHMDQFWVSYFKNQFLVRNSVNPKVTGGNPMLISKILYFWKKIHLTNPVFISEESTYLWIKGIQSW